MERQGLYDTGSYEDVNGASQRWTMNMTGAQANHMGIELDFIAKPFRWMEVNGMFSWGRLALEWDSERLHDEY